MDITGGDLSPSERKTMKLDAHSKLSPNTVLLHWLVGGMMIGLLATGLYMEQNEVFALYPWHKSFGVLIALFVALRLAWRVRNGWPSPAGDYTGIEQLLSKMVHHLLLAGTVVMPVSGFMMSAMGGHGVELLGLELVARNPDPADPREVIALDAGLAAIGHTLHGWAGYALIGAVMLHIAGAFKHHILDKDGTLKRMLGAEI